MLRAIWFFVKVGLVVGLAIWVADQPGDVQLQWLGYDLKVKMGIFLLALVGIILLAIFLYNVIDTFVGFPASYKRYREIRSREDGYQALTLGLTAVAAGDQKVAVREAKKIAKFMPDDAGLPRLLQAQAARLQGRHEDAREHFSAMLEHKDAAFLGVRGLLQAAMDAEDYGQALGLAREALAAHPKQSWILKIVYDLEIKRQEWAAARGTLKRLKKTDVMSAGQAALDLAAILIAEGEERLEEGFVPQALDLFKKAARAAPDFVPAALRLGAVYKQEGKRRSAMNAVRKIWRLEPHPEVEALWMALIPVAKAGDDVEREKWRRKLLGSEDVDFEEEKAWVCRVSGRAYGQWHWFAQPHGSFNTMVWQVPEGGVYGGDVLEADIPDSELLGQG